MKSLLIGLGLLMAGSGVAAAQGSPKIEQCAGIYGAFAEQQGAFGTTDSLMGERYINYARIDFDARLASLARKEERGVTELKTQSQGVRDDIYMKLVDAETEGDLDTDVVRRMIELSDTCDSEYGFSPSLGG